MIINTFSYIWTASAIDVICELARSGYKVFEVPITSPHCWPDEMTSQSRADGRKRIEDCAARVKSLNAGGYDVNLASPGANMRRKSVEHIRDVVDLAVDWGASDVVISPGTRRPMISPPLPQTLAWLHESLEALLPHAKQAGVRLLLENTPYCFQPTIGELADVVEQIGSEDVKIVYDVANAAFIEEDPVAALLAHHAKIGLVHISDTGLDVWGHDPIGTGIVDFEALGKAVEETCGVENVVLEVIREQTPLTVIEDGLRELGLRGWKVDA